MSTERGTAAPAPAPLLFDVDEAAARLSISRRSLYRLVAEGAPHRRIRGCRGVKFTDTDLDAIVADAAVAIPAPTARRRRRAA